MHQVSHTRTKNQTRHQVPGIIRCGVQTFELDREHSNVYIFGGESSSVMCEGGLFHLERHYKDVPGTAHHTYHTRYVDNK